MLFGLNDSVPPNKQQIQSKRQAYLRCFS